MINKQSIVETHPEVAKQFHPTLNGDLGVESLTKGSTKNVWWLGDCGHPWDVPVQQRTLAGQGCPICKGKRALIGVNDLTTCAPEVAKEWHPNLNGELTPEKVTRGSYKKVWWLGACGHEWDAIINDRVNKSSRCPVCANRKVVVGINDLITTHPELAAMWHPDKNGNLTPKAVTQGRKKPVHFICPEGHEWKGSIASEVVKQNGYCPPCSGYVVNPGVNDLKTLYPNKVKFWDEAKNGPLLNNQSPESHDLAHWKCAMGHNFTAIIRQYCKTYRSTCPICSGYHFLKGFNDMTIKYPEMAKEWHPTRNENILPDEIHPSTWTPYWWKCSVGHEWKNAPAKRLDKKKRVVGCPECYAETAQSTGERQVADFVESLGFEIRKSVRDIVRDPGTGWPLELDIVVESRKIAIEFNGVYFHSDRNPRRGEQYHHTKFTESRNAGYVLIQVWEDDWVERRPAVERMLMDALGVETDPVTVSALSTHKLEGDVAASFLDTHHVDGHRDAENYYGLLDDNDSLVAVVSLNSAGAGATIVQYASMLTIQRGFAELLDFSKSDMSFNRVIAYSDNCYDSGALYEANGFTQNGEVSPDYTWFYRDKRNHKRMFTLNFFRDSETFVSEESQPLSEIAKMNSIYRVWDAGQTRWVKEGV